MEGCSECNKRKIVSNGDKALKFCHSIGMVMLYQISQSTPHLRGVQLSTITLDRPHQHKQSKKKFSHFFPEDSHRNIKGNVLKCKSSNFDSFVKLSRRNVELITSTSEAAKLRMR